MWVNLSITYCSPVAVMTGRRGWLTVFRVIYTSPSFFRDHGDVTHGGPVVYFSEKVVYLDEIVETWHVDPLWKQPPSLLRAFINQPRNKNPEGNTEVLIKRLEWGSEPVQIFSHPALWQTCQRLRGANVGSTLTLESWDPRRGVRGSNHCV